MVMMCGPHSDIHANTNASSPSTCKKCGTLSKIRIGPLRPLHELRFLRRNGHG